jgi:serine/threonine-protein kinase
MAIVLTVIAGCQSEQQSSLVELPFTGLNEPLGVAVDTAGNLYVADSWNKRVLKLPAGSNTQVELPFTGLGRPQGVAVDPAGNVYVTDVDTDAHNTRLLKLPAGSTTQVVLSTSVGGLVAVDPAGNVDVTTGGLFIHRVYKLPAG